jgi:hypothetical protein
MASINISNYLPFGWLPLGQANSQRREDEDARQNATLSVTFVNSVAQMPRELGTAGFPLPLEGAWLYEALEQSGLHDQLSLLYALVWQRDVPVGAAPLFVMDVPMERACPEPLLKTLYAVGRIRPSILYQRTLFVGSPEAAQGTVGAVPGMSRRAVLLALQSALERKARDLAAEMIIWRAMPVHIAQDLDWLAQRCRLFRVVSLPGTIVTFSSPRKSDYFGQLKASRRQALKRKLKRSAEAVEVSVQVLQCPPPELLDEIFGLFRQTYLRAKAKLEELNHTWFLKIAELPTTYFLIMREKGTGAMIAATAFFDRWPMLVARHVGFDYNKPKSWMLYFRLWDALIDWALAKGFTSILSGPNSYAAKIQLGHDLIPLFNYIWHRNPLIHLIYRSIAQTLSWAKLDEGLALVLKASPGVAARAFAPGETGPANR